MTKKFQIISLIIITVISLIVYVVVNEAKTPVADGQDSSDGNTDVQPQ